MAQVGKNIKKEENSTFQEMIKTTFGCRPRKINTDEVKNIDMCHIIPPTWKELISFLII
jgi:hypothetical protein